jgi:hypothetical protein
MALTQQVARLGVAKLRALPNLRHTLPRIDYLSLCHHPMTAQLSKLVQEEQYLVDPFSRYSQTTVAKQLRQRLLIEQIFYLLIQLAVLTGL